MQSNFFERVYQESAAAYQRLEHNLVLNELFQGKLSSDGYKDVLKLFYQFYSLYEYRLIEADMGQRAGSLFYTNLKTPLLEADLKVLDYSLDRCRMPADMGLRQPGMGFAEALGTWFTLEKATFIWSRLTKVLKRKYGIDAATGLAFFTNYGNRFEFFWDDFSAFIASQISNEAHAAQFIRAGNQTLNALDRWLLQETPDPLREPSVILPFPGKQPGTPEPRRSPLPPRLIQIS